jgi:hypothetical protein
MKKILVVLLVILNSNIGFTVVTHVYNKQTEKQLQEVQSNVTEINNKNITKGFVTNPSFYLQKSLLENKKAFKRNVINPMKQKIENNERYNYRMRLLKWSIIFSTLFVSSCIIIVKNNRYANFVNNVRDEWIHVNQFLV